MIKEFDFPIVFRYIVGYLQIAKENDQKQQKKVKQHIPLPNRYPTQRYHHYQYQTNLHPVNHTKQYSFGKKRLVEIRYVPDQKQQKTHRQKTQGSSSTQRKTTIFGEVNLRKMQSHKTHVSNERKIEHEQNKSMKSFRSTTKRNMLLQRSNNRNKTNNFNNNNNNDSILQSNHGQSLDYERLKNKRTKINESKKDLISNNNDSNQSSIMSIIQSNKSLFDSTNNNNNLLSSSNKKRNLQRVRTEFIQLDNNNGLFSLNKSSNNKNELKKVTNFMLRSRMSKNLTKINNRQRFNDDYGDQGDDNKQNCNGRSVNGNGDNKDNINSMMNNNSDKQNQCLLKEGQHFIKRHSKLINNNNNNSNKVQFNDSVEQYEYKSDSQTSSEKIISQQAQEIKLFVRRMYRLKTQKIFRKNTQTNRIKKKLHQQHLLAKEAQDGKFFGNNKGKGGIRKGEKQDTNMFKKKQLQNPANYIGNTKIIRRVRRQSGQDDIIIPMSSYEMIPSSSNLSKKPLLFNRYNNNQQNKQQASNVFNELNLFHSMMQDMDPIEQNDKLSQKLSNKKLNMNPFRLLSEDSNRKGEIYQMERKKVFEWDQKMFKFSKKVINKSNQLGQLHVM